MEMTSHLTQTHNTYAWSTAGRNLEYSHIHDLRNNAFPNGRTMNRTVQLSHLSGTKGHLAYNGLELLGYPNILIRLWHIQQWNIYFFGLLQAVLVPFTFGWFLYVVLAY
jgi:hypothetical protein